MSDRDQLLQQLADDVRELVEPRQHTEPRWTWTRKRNRKLTKHVTAVPSLLNQLREHTREPVTEGNDNGGGTRNVPESRTPEGSRAFDLLLTIETGAAWWVGVAFRQPLRPHAEGNLANLVGCATTAGWYDQDQAAADIANWRRQAEEITGWRDPDRQPYVRCPTCNRLGTLRVDLGQRHAWCVACRSVWSEAEGTIGLLADHIRAERDHPTDTPAQGST